jgi:hypothetical protein
MRRREFIKILSRAAEALAQQPTMPVVGFLVSASPDRYSSRHRHHFLAWNNGWRFLRES